MWKRKKITERSYYVWAGYTVYSNSINPVEPVLTIKSDERETNW
jgi:hypothetical protein